MTIMTVTVAGVLSDGRYIFAKQQHNSRYEFIHLFHCGMIVSLAAKLVNAIYMFPTYVIKFEYNLGDYSWIVFAYPQLKSSYRLLGI